MLDLFEFRLVYFILYRLSVEYLPKVRGAMMAVFPSYPEEAPRDPKEFERFCARLLWEKGYRDVRWVGRPGDMSLDIICRGLTEEKVGVQCKRYSPETRVGPKEIREFIGALTINGCERGVFITTSTLTDAAWRIVKTHGSIEVIDDPKLRRKIKWLHGSHEYYDESYPDSGELIVYEDRGKNILAGILSLLYLFGFIAFLIWLMISGS